MAVPLPAETSSSSRCLHQQNPCTFGIRGQSRVAFFCQSQSTLLRPRPQRKQPAGATGFSANHTQTLVQTPHSSVLPAHSLRLSREDSSWSELAIADYLLEERRRIGAPQVQTKPSNAQPQGGAAALAAEQRRLRCCYPHSKADPQHAEQSSNSNFLERRPKVQVPPRLQGCLTEVVPQRPAKKTATSLDGDAQLALWHTFYTAHKALAKVEELQLDLGRKPSHSQAATAAGLPSAAALKQCLEDGRRAKLQLMAANMGMVKKLASGYNEQNVAFQELVQAGLVGLETGLTRFNPSRGAKLSTAIFFYIRDAIFKTYRVRSHVIQIPVTTQEQVWRFDACVEQYQRQHPGEQPSLEYIMKATKLHRQAVERVWEMKSRRVLSIDALPSSNGGGQDDGNPDTLLELISNEHDCEEDERRQHLHLDAMKMLDALPGSMRDIVQERYGLLDGQDKTFEEVSVKLGMRKWKVQDMHRKAVKSMQETAEFAQLASAL